MPCITAQTIDRQLVAPREGVNLIGTSSHRAKKAFNRIGTANMVLHRLWKGINEVGSQRVASAIDSEEGFSKVVTL